MMHLPLKYWLVIDSIFKYNETAFDTNRGGF